jgi:signal transduction histidine kinase
MGQKADSALRGESIAELLISHGPFPTVTAERGLLDGIAFSQLDVCKTCTDRRCVKLAAASGIIRAGVCYRGVGAIAVGTSRGTIVINGLFTPDTHRQLARRDKKRFDDRIVDPARLETWREITNVRLRELEAAIERKVDDGLGMMHDVQTVVSSLLRSVEEYVAQQPGSTNDARFDRLPPSAKRIVKSVELLQARLALLPLLSNPAAAKYGQKHSRPIYRLVDRLVRILKPLADSRKVGLELTGGSYQEPHAFDSFETVPLVLIDNAIKYSQPGQAVEVSVTDVGHGVRFSVQSFSPEIPSAQRDAIFERGYRGEHAEHVTSRGSGLGLFLARTVADAHGFAIRHSAAGSPVMFNGVPYCSNTFAFVIVG